MKNQKGFILIELMIVVVIIVILVVIVLLVYSDYIKKVKVFEVILVVLVVCIVVFEYVVGIGDLLLVIWKLEVQKFDYVLGVMWDGMIIIVIFIVEGVIGDIMLGVKLQFNLQVIWICGGIVLVKYCLGICQG